MPTEAIRHKVAHPSNSTERPSDGLNTKYAGLWTLTLTYSCMVHDWPLKQKQIPPLERIKHTTSRQSARSIADVCRVLERDYEAGEPILLIPRVGSAYR